RNWLTCRFMTFIIFLTVYLFFFFFFFQAEDGIRDGHVTGVQTCALPISGPSTRRRARRAPSRPAGSSSSALCALACRDRWSRSAGSARTPLRQSAAPARTPSP